MSAGNRIQAVFEASSRQSTPRAATVRRDSRAGRARFDLFWAWASLLVLVVCWDAAFRLDRHASLPRMQTAHAADQERGKQRMELAELRGKSFLVIPAQSLPST